MAANVAAGSDSNPDFKSAFRGGSSVKYFEKKIEFVPARKPFNGLPRGGPDFKIETLNPSGADQSRNGFVQAAAAAANGKVKKGDGSECFDGWLDPELSLSVSFPRIGAGLQNLGNTCFLNSVLQCLTYTEPLAAYLQSGKHQSSCRINGFCALCAIQKHVSLTLKATGRSLAPKDLVANLRCISRNFRNARQEDAHEYMVNLLESMHKCCLPSGVPSESAGAYDKSLVHKIFGGRLRSQVKCMQCNNCSNKFDPFLDLSLEIDRAESLQKAIKHFTAPEPLDGGERQYQCEKCKQKVRALKQLTIHKAPYVLTIHLKRFHSLNPNQKINKNVSFETTLDLKQFVSGSYEGDLKYSLYGVLVHHGWSTRSGHYFCYVRTSTNMWYSLDDNQVRQVSESAVLQQKAYMLFYVRSRNSAPRKRVEIAPKERLRENNQNLNMVSSFAFSKSPSCSVQASQIADKSCVKVTSSSSDINKEVISVSSVKEELEPAPKDSGNMVSTPNRNVENKTVDSDASGKSSKESTVTDGLKYTSDKKDDMHEMNEVPSGNMSDKTDTAISANTSSHEISQGRDVGASVVEKSLGLVHGESNTLTSSSTVSSSSSQVGTVDSNASKKHKKRKKYQLASINFGLSLLLRMSLGPRKKLMKKKHRVKKERTACDSGPSTSDITDSVPSVQRRKVKSSKKKVKDKGAKTEEKATKGTSFKDSETSETKVIENVKDCKNDNMPNGLMSIVTRGVEETLGIKVTRWDEIDLPPSSSIELPNANAGNTIGHVLDEWDEELDRGKRKKVRQSKLQFGGPNHFQEIASRQIQQSKKAKFDRAFAGNHPLRI